MNVPESLLASKATSKALRDAIAAHAELRERDRQQVRAVAAAEHELDVAEAQEVKAGADAIRAGKPMPPSQLAEQREQLDEMRREASALEHAVRDAEQAVRDAVDANRAKWREAQEGVSDQRRQELIAA